MPLNLSWLTKKDKDGKDQLEAVLPDEITKKLDKLDKFDPEKLNTLDTLKASMDSINARFTKEDQEREAEKQRKTADANRAKQEETDEQIAELMLTDPAAATQMLIKKQTEPHANAILTLRADQIKREMFDDTEKYPYYVGDFKSEVDKLLDAQSVAARNDRSVIEHAYFSTLGRKSKELAEGKLKSRFASSESSRGTNGGNLSGKGNEEPPVITDDVRRIAAMFGEKPEEYAKRLQEEGIGYV
jgi:hypothetical protein